MGNSSSSHQPLERGFTRGTFGDIKNVVGIKFHNSNENIESVACGFPGNRKPFLFLFLFTRVKSDSPFTLVFTEGSFVPQ